MKKFISQITAVTLAFCMLAALVPAMPVQTAKAADGDIVLDFCLASANTSILSVDTKTLGGWTWNQEETASYIADNIINNTNGLKNWWAFREISGAYGGLQVAFYTRNVAAQRMAFDFEVPESDWYDLSDSSILALVKANQLTAEIDVISDGVVSKAASIWLPTDGEADALADLKKFETEKVYLTKGTNTLIIRGTAMTSGAYDHTMLWVQKIVFTKTTAPTAIEAKDVVLDFTSDTFGALYGDNSAIDYIVDYCGWNWKYNADLTSSAQAANIPAASREGANTSGDDNGQMKLRKTMGGYYMNLATRFGNLVFDINVENAGWYKINTDGVVSSGVGSADSGITNVYAGAKNAPVKLAATIDSKSTASGEQSVITVKDAVYFEKGDNLLVLRGIENCTSTQYPNNLTLIKRITFSPISDDEAPVEATEPYTQYIETNADNVGSQLATDAKLALHGWEVDESGTSASMYGFLADPSSTTIPRFFKMHYSGSSELGVSGSHMSTYFSWGDDNTTLSLKFYNAVAGIYDISAITYEYPESTVVGNVSVNNTQVGTITCDATENAYTEMNKKLAGKVYLNEGENTLTITKTGGGSGFNLAKLILTPYVEPEVETRDDIFGNVFAYVQRDDSGIKVNFIGGIKDINYKAVGFKVSVNGGDAVGYTTQNVYETLNVDGTSYTPVNFGAEGGYVFHTDEIGVSADDEVVIEAYVISEGENGDEEITYGQSYKVTIK